METFVGGYYDEFEFTSSDEESAENFESLYVHCNHLHERMLSEIESNDPDCAGVFVSASNWIEGAGPAIRNSTMLKKIHLSIGGNDDVTWLHEFCSALSHNQSIDSFSLLLETESNTCRQVQNELQIISLVFENNCNIRKVKIQNHSLTCILDFLVLVVLKCKNDQLESIELESTTLDGLQAASFFSFLSKLQHSVTDLSLPRCDLRGKGWKSLAKLLVNPESKIQNLDITQTCLHDGCVAIIRKALIKNNTVSSLCMHKNDALTATGWRRFSKVLRHPLCTLEKLDLSANTMCDESVTHLGNALAINKTVKSLELSCQRTISVAGWRGFSKCLRSAACVLEEIFLDECSIDDDMASVIVKSLKRNTCLKRLSMYEDFVTEKVWAVLSPILCDQSSIHSSYSSNHTLSKFRVSCGYPWFGRDRNILNGFLPYLRMNKNAIKVEVARQKVMYHHFSGRRNSEINVFACMPETTLPFAFEWIGRNNIGFSLMYTVVRSFPTLFSHRSHAGGMKRKR